MEEVERFAGLSKEEDDVTPYRSLSYHLCCWQVVRRWIMDGKICPRYPALSDYYNSMDNLSSEDCTASYLSGFGGGDEMHCSVGGNGCAGAINLSVECPICMNNYFAVNAHPTCLKR